METVIFKILYFAKFIIFALPYLVGKYIFKDKDNFNDFVDHHTEEATAGVFGGLSSIWSIFTVTPTEAHDIFITVVKAVLGSFMGYFIGFIIKKGAIIFRGYINKLKNKHEN